VGGSGNLRQNSYYRNLKWTFEVLLPCYCYSITTNSTTIRWQVSQPASTGKGSDYERTAPSVLGTSRSRLCPRTVTRGRGGRSRLKLFSPTLEKSVGHCLKHLGPSQKTLRHTWCPKLVTVLLSPMGLAFIYPALPTCLVVYAQKSDCHFCVVIVVKKLMYPAQVVFSYFVLYRSEIPLVLTTKVILLRSLLFRQPDVVNCVLFLGLSQNRLVQLVDNGC